MLAKTVLKAPPKPTNVIPMADGVSATAKDLEQLIRSVCAQGDWQKASLLIKGAHQLLMVPTWRTYKDLLQCMAVRTNWRSSLPVIAQLAAGQMSTHALYRTFVTLCAEAKDGESALRVLAEASQRGVGMGHAIYLAVARCFLDCGMHAELMELPSRMVKDRVPVSNELLTVLLEGCSHCDGEMAEHAKMIMERVRSEKTPITAPLAEHYLLSLASSDWEFGTRQYLSMPYDVRQDSNVMAALAFLMMRGGKPAAAMELVERQLWGVKGFNSNTIDRMLDAYCNALAANRHQLNEGDHSTPSPFDWRRASTEACRIFFSRRGHTDESGDAALACFWGSSTADISDEQLIAAANFISKAKDCVPSITFSPRSAMPLLAALPWEAAHQLLLDQFETRLSAAKKEETESSGRKQGEASLNLLSNTEDLPAFVAFVLRKDVPADVLTSIIKRVPAILENAAVLKRLVGSEAVASRFRGCSSSSSSSSPSSSSSSPLIDSLVATLGPHAAATALYNVSLSSSNSNNSSSGKGVGDAFDGASDMWRHALRVLQQHVKGPDELTETIISTHRLWAEAVQYAEGCESGREETLRRFAVPVCAVCDRWVEVERILDRVGATNDTDRLLLREARRRNRQDTITQLLNLGANSKRLGERCPPAVEAAQLWIAFHAEEGMLLMDKALGDRIVVSLLNTRTHDGDSHLPAAGSGDVRAAAGERTPRAELVSMAVRVANSVANNTSSSQQQQQPSRLPCHALTAVQKMLADGRQCLDADEARDANMVAALMLLSPTAEAKSLVLHTLTRGAPLGPSALMSTSAVIDAMSDVEDSTVTTEPIPTAILKSMGSLNSSPLDAAVQRMAVRRARRRAVTGAPSGAVSWDLHLAVYDYCKHIAVTPLIDFIGLLIANKANPITVKATILPILNSTLNTLLAAEMNDVLSSSPAQSAASSRRLALASQAVSLFIYMSDLTAALATYQDHPQLLTEAESDRFLLVCSHASIEGEDAMRAQRKAGIPEQIRSLLRGGKWQLAGRLYTTHRALLSSTFAPPAPSLLTTANGAAAVSAPSPLLAEVLTELIPRDPVAASLLVQHETIASVGIESVHKLLIALTSHAAHPSVGGGGLLHAARLLEWLADQDARLATDGRIALLLNACVPYDSNTTAATAAAKKNPPSSPLAATSPTIDHRPMLKQTLQVLKRIAEKTSHHKVVQSLIHWIDLGATEGFSATEEEGGAVDAGGIEDILFGNTTRAGRVSLLDNGVAAEVEAASFSPSVWTEERKERAAKYYPYLRDNVGMAPPSGSDEEAMMAHFAHVAVTEFQGEVTAKDVKYLWFRSNGGSQRHLGRLYAASIQKQALASRYVKPSDASKGLGAKDRHDVPARRESRAGKESLLTIYELLAQHMLTIRFGFEDNLQQLCKECFPSHTPSSLRTLAFRSNAAVRAAIRDKPHLIAGVALPSPLPQQLLARLSDYAQCDLKDAAVWRAIAIQVFHGCVTPSAVGEALQKHQHAVRSTFRQRWSRAAEREIAANVDKSGIPPSFLETEPQRTRDDIARYFKRYHWVFRQKGSFAPQELEAVAEAVVYASEDTTSSLRAFDLLSNGDAGDDALVCHALDECVSTHSSEEVKRLVSGIDGALRAADSWHASFNVYNPHPSEGAALLNLPSSLAAFDATPLITVTRDSPVVPRESEAKQVMGAHTSASLSSNAEKGEDASSSLAIAKRLAIHQKRDKGYITYGTAKQVLMSGGEKALLSTAAWLAQQGFTVSEADARKMMGLPKKSLFQRRVAQSPSPSQGASNPPSLLPPHANKPLDPINAATAAAWLRGLAHLPLLQGACKVLLSKIDDSSVSDESDGDGDAVKAEATKWRRAELIVKNELIRLSRSRACRKDASEAWALMLRYGFEGKLPAADRLDIAVALAGA